MPFDTRHAEISKSYRRISQNTYIAGISSIETSNSAIPGQLRLKWSLVVVGENGVGKTQLLKHLEKYSGNLEPFGNVNLDVRPNTTFKYYCPSDEVVSLREMVKVHLSDEVKDEILTQYEPLVFSSDDIEHINYILSSSFSSIHVYEVDLDGNAFPYFIVNSDNSRGLLELSHGELYCIHLYWILNYSCQSNTVILLDEPETYLYPTAQQRLVNIILRMEFFRTSQVIFATHSQVIPSLLKAGSVYRMVKIGQDLYDFYDDGTNFRNDDLGLRAGKAGVIFTEDVKAAYFLKLLIEKGGYAGSDFEIVSASNGYSSFNSFWDNFGKRTSKFKFLFCYDADAVRLNLVRTDLESSSIILPGNEPPEKELISYAYKDITGFLNSRVVSSLLPRNRLGNFLTTLTENRSTNHHDFFHLVAIRIGLDEFRLFEMFFDHWFALSDNKEKVDAFMDRLNELFRN